MPRNKITTENVEKGYEEVKEIKRKYYLERLGVHHKLMYEVVKKILKLRQAISTKLISRKQESKD